MIRNVASLLGTAAAAQLVVLASTPLLLKFYDSAQFGELATLIGAVNIVTAATTLRLEYAIPMPRSERIAQLLAVVALALSVALGFCVAIASWMLPVTVFAGVRLPFTGIGGASLLFLYVVAVGVFQVFLYYCTRKRAYSCVGGQRVAQAGLGAALQVGLSGLPIPGLVTGDLMARLLAPVAAYRTCRLHAFDRLTRRCFRIRVLLALLSRYRAFVGLQTPAAVMNTAVSNAIPLLIFGKYGVVQAGLYFLLMRLIGSPLALVGQAVSQVFFAETASLVRSGETSLLRRVLGSVSAMGALAAGMGLAGYAGIDAAFRILAVEYATDLTWIFWTMFPMLASQLLASPVSQIFVLLEKQGIQFAWDTCRLVGVVFVLTHAASAATFAGGLALLAWTLTVFNIVHVSAALVAVSRFPRA